MPDFNFNVKESIKIKFKEPITMIKPKKTKALRKCLACQALIKPGKSKYCKPCQGERLSRKKTYDR